MESRDRYTEKGIAHFGRACVVGSALQGVSSSSVLGVHSSVVRN